MHKYHEHNQIRDCREISTSHPVRQVSSYKQIVASCFYCVCIYCGRFVLNYFAKYKHNIT